MAESVKGKTLYLALSEARLGELPVQYKDGMGWWSRAVVLVRRRGLVENYALAERSVRGVFRIVRDFGPVMPIVAVIGIYPYAWLRGICTVGAGYRDEESMRAYLRRYNEDRFVQGRAGLQVDTPAYIRLRRSYIDRMAALREGDADELLVQERLRIQDLTELGIRDTTVPVEYRDGVSADALPVEEVRAKGETYEIPEDSPAARPARVHIRRGRPKLSTTPKRGSVDVSDEKVVGVKKIGRPRKIRPDDGIAG